MRGSGACAVRDSGQVLRGAVQARPAEQKVVGRHVQPGADLLQRAQGGGGVLAHDLAEVARADAAALRGLLLAEAARCAEAKQCCGKVVPKHRISSLFAV